MSENNWLSAVRFGPDGLVPVVAQERRSGDVLMLAYADREALERTLSTGLAHYFSRTRKTLWRKGETSGHVQRLVELRIDCDRDSLLLVVDQAGPACHTRRPSCFFTAIRDGAEVILTDPVQPPGGGPGSPPDHRGGVA